MGIDADARRARGGMGRTGAGGKCECVDWKPWRMRVGVLRGAFAAFLQLIAGARCFVCSTTTDTALHKFLIKGRS